MKIDKEYFYLNLYIILDDNKDRLQYIVLLSKTQSMVAQRFIGKRFV